MAKEQGSGVWCEDHQYVPCGCETEMSFQAKKCTCPVNPYIPLSISLAAKLSKEFAGKLRISYSGGADYYNIDKIVGCGIWPVTMATTLLKTGGYQRFTQVADKVRRRSAPKKWDGINVDALKKLAADAIKDAHHVKEH